MSCAIEWDQEAVCPKKSFLAASKGVASARQQLLIDAMVNYSGREIPELDSLDYLVKVPLHICIVSQ
jgi:hypothetical protein